MVVPLRYLMYTYICIYIHTFISAHVYLYYTAIRNETPAATSPSFILGAGAQATCPSGTEAVARSECLGARQAIAAQRARRYRVDFDPDSEVLVTVGASEAIAAAVLGLVEPGSEVLLIEPFSDTYSPVIAMAERG